MKNSLPLPQNLKQNIMIQQFHFWEYVLKRIERRILKQIFANPCSWQHSQYPEHATNSSFCWWVKRSKIWPTHITGYYTDLNPGSYVILLSTASNLASIMSPTHNWVLSLLWLHPFILSGVISPLISCSILGSDHRKSKKVPEKISISALLTMPKPLTVWITINCGKFWKRWE